MTNTNKNIKQKKIINCFLSSGIVFMILSMLLILKHYAPFGNNCFAWMDGNIQYMDFFAYLKDVLEGKNSLIYTLGSTLGNTGIGIFSYYLSSPLNYLIIFIKKAQIPTFFNILVVLKLSISAFTFSYYLQERFKNKIKPIFICALSISYALMQYNIAQASNIMWIDGVYMLPLILLGVYRLVNYKKIHLLSITVGLSIIFNWYTGGINCLFSAFWFILEEILYIMEKDITIKQKIKIFIISGIRYTSAMIIGVMISAILFLPTVLILTGGRGSSFDLTFLKNIFRGNIITSLQNYSLGSVSSETSLSIFCGTIPLLGVILFFKSNLHSKKKKAILGITLFTALMLCYWQPLFMLFSLLKYPLSYWYRYAYVIIFTFIYIASFYYAEIDKETDNKIILLACIFSFVLLMLNYIKESCDIQLIYYTIICVITISTILILYLKYKNKEKISKFISFALLLCVIFEMSYNTKLLMNKYQYSDANQFSEYQEKQQKQIDAIKSYDKSNYRISQTKTRNTGETNLTLNYNEALAFNYMSNAGYTSMPDNDQLEFLNKLGYRMEGNNTNITNTSIITADSLLGVKYVLSPEEINGLKQLDGIEEANGKKVYENPYVISMAIVTDNSDMSIEYTNPFEYQNKIYSKLAKENIELYKKVQYKKTLSDDNKKAKYDISIPDGNYALYGNLPWSEIASENINVNNVYSTAYACSTSPSVFYIPYQDNKAYIEVETSSKLSISDEQFYILDLNVLKEVTEKINANKIDNLKIENNKISLKVEANSNQQALISVPLYKGMQIQRNGEKLEVTSFEDCFMEIPLVDGENNVEITFKIPGFYIGIVISLIGIMFLISISIINKYIKK